MVWAFFGPLMMPRSYLSEDRSESHTENLGLNCYSRGWLNRKNGGSGHSHTDFDQCDGDADMVSDQSRNDGERKPEGCDRKQLFHRGVLLDEPCEASVLGQRNRLQRLFPHT